MRKYIFRKNDIIKRHLNGKTLYDIAKEKGCSYVTIFRWFKKHKIKPLHLHKNSLIPKLTPIQLSYLAGIIDGEGWIGKDKRTNLWRIMITNVNLQLMQYISKIIPQGTTITLKKYSPKHQTRYSWRLGRQLSCYQLFKQIFPYLIVKIPQTKQAIKELTKRFTSLRHQSKSE